VRWLAYQLKLLLLAVQFLTRVPVHGKLAAWVGYTPDMLRASARFFPLVGLLIGSAGALIFFISATLWSPWIAAVLTLSFTALMTGAFHEDGLADYADGIGGGSTPARVLEIMKDSRIGSYGALALILSTSIKLAALGSMVVSLAVFALPLAHVSARVCACCVLTGLNYVRDDDSAKSKPMAQSMRGAELAFAILTLVIVMGLTLRFAPHVIGNILAGLLLAGLSTALIAHQMYRRIGGFTGDALGATEQIAECAVLLAFASPLIAHLSADAGY
jgi:adenosylcobinamide-GDP ribazoletransferase